MGDCEFCFYFLAYLFLETKVLPQHEKTADFISHASLSETPRQAHIQVLPQIDNTNRNFKGQQKNEVVYCFCRRHWMVLIPNLVLFACAAGLTGAFFIYRGAIGPVFFKFGLPIIVLGFTYALHYFFLRILVYYLQILIITNFRVIQLDQTVYFSRARDSLDIAEIQNIEIHQKGVMKTLLGYGELVITLSSAHATKVFRYVPNPEYHFRKINKTKREYITSRRASKVFQPGEPRE